MNSINEALMNTDIMIRTSIVKTYGPKIALLYLLYKLDAIGMRRVTQTLMQILSSAEPLLPPPCSMAMYIVGLHRDYLQFCPKRMADKDI